jgi:hypothetical protein
MAEPQPTPSLNPSEVPARLHEIAELLRGTHHLGPDAQQALAEFADELGKILEQAAAPPHEAAPLVETTGHVVEALHQEQGVTQGTAARHRLQELAAEFDARAPRVADFARRLLDALANLGI